MEGCFFFVHGVFPQTLGLAERTQPTNFCVCRCATIAGVGRIAKNVICWSCVADVGWRIFFSFHGVFPQTLGLFDLFDLQPMCPRVGLETWVVVGSSGEKKRAKA
ncbi:unnamed protein product [Ectocarpus fasciculatus]